MSLWAYFPCSRSFIMLRKKGALVGRLRDWMSVDLVSPSFLSNVWVSVISKQPTLQTSNQLVYSQHSSICHTVTKFLISPRYTFLLKPHILKKKNKKTSTTIWMLFLKCLFSYKQAFKLFLVSFPGLLSLYRLVVLVSKSWSLQTLTSSLCIS